MSCRVLHAVLIGPLIGFSGLSGCSGPLAPGDGGAGEPTVTLEGTVTSEEGEPLKPYSAGDGAMVRLCGTPDCEVQALKYFASPTDANGWYHIGFADWVGCNVSEGTWYVQAVAWGYVTSAKVYVTSCSPPVQRIDFVLERDPEEWFLIRVEGIATDAASREPRSGYLVEVYRGQYERERVGPPLAATTTDADGRYALNFVLNCVPGSDWMAIAGLRTPSSTEPDNMFLICTEDTQVWDFWVSE